MSFGLLEMSFGLLKMNFDALEMSFSLFDLKFYQYYDFSPCFVSVFDVNNAKIGENYQKSDFLGSVEMSFTVSEMSLLLPPE